MLSKFSIISITRVYYTISIKMGVEPKKTIETVKKIEERGYGFYIIALSSPEDDSTEFMKFINNMAAAAGGVSDSNGDYDIVFPISDTGIFTALLEAASEANGNHVDVEELECPREAEINVPYEGIMEVDVTISGAIDAVDELTELELTDPSGNTYILCDEYGFYSQENIEVDNSGNNNVVIKMTDPADGIWNLYIDSEKPITLTKTVTISHNIRFEHSVNDGGEVYAGGITHIQAWLQKWDHNAQSYVDLQGDDVYQQSEMYLTLEGNGKTQSLKMDFNEEEHCFCADVDLSSADQWNAVLSVTNNYFDRQDEPFTIDVLPTPEAMTITSTSIAPLEGMDENLFLISRGTSSDNVTFTVDVSGDYDTVSAEIVGDNGDTISVDNLTIDYGSLSDDTTYTFQAQAESEFHTASSEPLTFMIYPAPVTVTNLNVTNASTDDLGQFVSTSGSIQVTWDADSSNVKEYVVLRDGVEQTRVTTNSAKVSLPSNGETYEIGVKAIANHDVNETGEETTVSVFRRDLTLWEKIQKHPVRYSLILLGILAVVGVFCFLSWLRKPCITGKLTIYVGENYYDLPFAKTGKLRLVDGEKLETCKKAKKRIYNNDDWDMLKGIKLRMVTADDEGYIDDITSKVYGVHAKGIHITYENANEYADDCYVVEQENSVDVKMVGGESGQVTVSFSYEA